MPIVIVTEETIGLGALPAALEGVIDPTVWYRMRDGLMVRGICHTVYYLQRVLCGLYSFYLLSVLRRDCYGRGMLG
jgi:hypothetical protein